MIALSVLMMAAAIIFVVFLLAWAIASRGRRAA